MDGDDLQAVFDLGWLTGLLLRDPDTEFVSADPASLSNDIKIRGRKYTIQIVDAEVQ